MIIKFKLCSTIWFDPSIYFIIYPLFMFNLFMQVNHFPYFPHKGHQVQILFYHSAWSFSLPTEKKTKKITSSNRRLAVWLADFSIRAANLIYFFHYFLNTKHGFHYFLNTRHEFHYFLNTKHEFHYFLNQGCSIRLLQSLGSSQRSCYLITRYSKEKFIYISHYVHILSVRLIDASKPFPTRRLFSLSTVSP